MTCEYTTKSAAVKVPLLSYCHDAVTDLDEVVEVLLRELTNLSGPRSTEHEGLTVRTDAAQDLGDLLSEPHVQHTVMEGQREKRRSHVESALVRRSTHDGVG